MNPISELAAVSGRCTGKMAGCNDEQTEAWIYVLERFFTHMTILIVLILTYLPFNIIKSTLVYYIVFMVFRTCFGGWHSKNEMVCLILSILIPVAANVLVVQFDFSRIFIIGTYIIAAIIGLVMGTAVHENRPLGEDEQTTQRRTVRLKSIGLSLLLLLFIIHILLIKGNVGDGMTMGVLVAFINRLFVRNKNV